MALKGCAFANGRRGRHLITTQIEHPAVLNTMRYLETMGYQVTYLPVDGCGRIGWKGCRSPRTLSLSSILPPPGAPA